MSTVDRLLWGFQKLDPSLTINDIWVREGTVAEVAARYGARANARKKSKRKTARKRADPKKSPKGKRK